MALYIGTNYSPHDWTSKQWKKDIALMKEAGINVLLDISTRPAPVWVHKLCPGCNIYGKAVRFSPA